MLDANVLIDANRDYYGIGQVDEYWEWLIHQGLNDIVKIPIEIYEEVKEGKDALASWAKDKETAEALKFDEDVDIDLVRKVMDKGYANDLNDIEVEEVGRDPFLIAYALADPLTRCIVTTERSKPSRKRHKRHIPDVCADFGIQTFDAFRFGKKLGFKTNWKP